MPLTAVSWIDHGYVLMLEWRMKSALLKNILFGGITTNVIILGRGKAGLICFLYDNLFWELNEVMLVKHLTTVPGTKAMLNISV